MKGASTPHQARHPCELEPGAQVHAWRVVRTLGEGGYGFVYLVELPGLEGEHFTLKLSKFRQGEGGARADKERVLLSRVEHPNIVRVWGHGYWPHPARGWPYLLMEYVEGPSLWQWLERHNPTPRDVTAMVAALADALAAVHDRGALHRDVKGDNVLVRASDGQPVLLDFGVGDYEDSETLTQAVLPPGTTHYRSPESLRFLREHRDTKARYEFHPTDDLYALGVVFFRLLADEYPFSPSLPPDLLYADIEHRAPPEPGFLNPRVPSPLSAIVLKLLAKHPEERIANARALHEQLLAMLREADASWDSPLFDWRDERTPQSRTTDEAPRLQGAPSPGTTHAARRVRQRRVEPITVQEASPAPPLAPRPWRAREAPSPTPMPAEVATELRFQRRLLSAGTLIAVAILLLMVARVGLGGTPEERAPPSTAPVQPFADGGSAMKPAAPAETAPASPPAVVPPTTAASAPIPQGSARSMNPKKTPPPVPSTSEKRLNTLVGQCLAVAATASMAAACSGAPVRPERKERCPAEVVRIMEKNGLQLDQHAIVWIDASDADALEEDQQKPDHTLRRPFVKVYENGPITSRVYQPLKSGAPKGTLLYGYIWVDADPVFAIIHYTEAVFPSGLKIPVCMHATDSKEPKGYSIGIPKQLGSRPRAAMLNPGYGAAVTDLYP